METSNPAPTSHHRRLKLWIILAAIIVLLGAGVLGWLLWQARDESAKLNRDKATLETSLKDVRKKLADATSALEAAKKSTSTSPAAGCTTASVTPSIKSNIAAAISSGNTAALAGYMASTIRVTFAASEMNADRTQAEAITDLNYLSGATTPWNFALPASTLTAYATGDYAAYLGSTRFIGQSSDFYVVAFGFDSCAKINAIFMTNSADLLH